MTQQGYPAITIRLSFMMYGRSPDTDGVGCRTPCPRSVDKGVKLFLPSPLPADNLLSSPVPHLSLQTCNLSPRRHPVCRTSVQLYSDVIQACFHIICESTHLAILCDVTHAKQRTADVIRLQPFSQGLDYVFCFFTFLITCTFA